MKKANRNPQDKHRWHTVEVLPTTVHTHKFVMRCVDCNGAFIKWASEHEHKVYMSLQSDKVSDAN